MPFSWYHASVPADYRKTLPGKREAMYLREVEERAALLCRLRYPRAHAAARLRGNVHWDFEHRGDPEFIKRIDDIVDAVYVRGGRAGGPPEP